MFYQWTRTAPSDELSSRCWFCCSLVYTAMQQKHIWKQLLLLLHSDTNIIITIIMYLNKTFCSASSTPGFSKSSKLASGLSFHISSSLLIWAAFILRDLSWSVSEGTLTSQERKLLSSIKGFHFEWSNIISLLVLCAEAQGYLISDRMDKLDKRHTPRITFDHKYFTSTKVTRNVQN